MVRGGLLDRLERRGASQTCTPSVTSSPANSPDYDSALATIQRHILEAHPALLGEARRKEEGRQQLRSAIQQLIAREGLASGKVARDALTETVLNEVTGLGPLEPLLQDDTVTEIMVNGWNEIWIERNGLSSLHECKFRDQRHLLEVISRVVAPLGRRIDQSMPFVDGRLPDGSRLHACIPPVSLRGPIVTIRKFPREGFCIDDLVRLGSVSEECAVFLRMCVSQRFNVIIAGGTGSGKTSTLNALLSDLGGTGERVVTIEDCAEIHARVPNLVSLESRPPNIEGRGEISIRALVRNALRMRPDRLVVGEVRGAEAFDMLQAMNTGHQGSMSTVHANGPADALKRLEGMALCATEVPERVVKELIPSALDIVIFQKRLPSGERKITDVSLVSKDVAEGPRRLIPVFVLRAHSGEHVLERSPHPLPSWFSDRCEGGGGL